MSLRDLALQQYGQEYNLDYVTLMQVNLEGPLLPVVTRENLGDFSLARSGKSREGEAFMDALQLTYENRWAGNALAQYVFRDYSRRDEFLGIRAETTDELLEKLRTPTIRKAEIRVRSVGAKAITFFADFCQELRTPKSGSGTSGVG